MLGLGTALIRLSGAPDDGVYKSASLDGTNDYIQLGNIGTVRSFQIWFKPNTTLNSVTSTRRLVGFNSAGTGYYGIHISQATGLFANETITVLPGANSRTSDTQLLYSTNWYHLVIVWDGTVFQIYVNGVNTTVNDGNNGSTDTLPSFSSLRIGTDNSSTVDAFGGLVDEIATWSSSLTASEILSLYNSGYTLDARNDAGNYASSANLTGYWRCDDSNMLDVSTNSNNGTPINGVAFSDDTPAQ
jgi:hypothetical protein